MPDNIANTNASMMVLVVTRSGCVLDPAVAERHALPRHAPRYEDYKDNNEGSEPLIPSKLNEGLYWNSGQLFSAF
jgi:hypothetical protein